MRTCRGRSLVPGGFRGAAYLSLLSAFLSYSSPLHCLSLLRQLYIADFHCCHIHCTEYQLTMTYTRKTHPWRRRLSLFTIALLTTAVAASRDILHKSPSQIFPRIVSPRTTSNVPLKITNNCPETIWPALASQTGTGPGTGGFEQKPGTSQSLVVSGDWQGRIWGRTNCSFNADGSGASNLNGNNGGGQACQTGDCNGVLSCVVTACSPSHFPSKHLMKEYRITDKK